VMVTGGGLKFFTSSRSTSDGRKASNEQASATRNGWPRVFKNLISPSPVSAEPVVSPASPPAPSSPSPWNRRRLWGAVWLAVLLLAGLASRSWRTDDNTGGGTPTATVERKDFVRTLRIHGVIEAVTFHAVAAPRLSGQGNTPMIITRLIPAGTRVQPGDLLAEFDRQAQTKNYLDRQTEYRDRVEQIRKKAAERVADGVRDERELKEAEHAVEKAALDVKRNEILSRIDAEKNNQSHEEARARLEQVRRTIGLRQSVVAAEVRILEIQRDRDLAAMRNAERNSDRMVIRSPLAGLVVLNTIFKSNGPGEVQEGDEVRPGVPFMQVVDPQSMQVRARVNQVDALHLEAGQKATVRLDAYPDLAFPGQVHQVAAIALGGSFSDRIRTFPVTFTIEGSDPRTMPDLSAAVDVELERVPGALVAPRDAVLEESGRHFLRIRNGSGFDKTPVTLGRVGEQEVVVQSGAREGTVVLRGRAAEGGPS
jgi:biotin carboxyl carrier protein